MKTVDYFALFGLQERYQVDRAELRKIFLARSRALHPDFFGRESSLTQDEALKRSAENNLAYQTLDNPDKRLAYLFDRYGLLGADAETKATLPQDFLLDMMDLNELAEEVKQANGAGQKELDRQIQALAASFGEEIQAALIHFDNATAGDERVQALNLALIPYLKQRYVLRIQAQMGTFAK